MKTPDGLEVDFLARVPAADPELIQVCADPSDAATLSRELRALAATTERGRVTRRLLVLDREGVAAVSAPGIEIQPAYEWLLRPPASA